MGRFVEGVYITRVGNTTITSEGYFINNQTTSSSITYESGSTLLVKGDKLIQSHYILNSQESVASKGIIITNGFGQPYAIVIETLF